MPDKYWKPDAKEKLEDIKRGKEYLHLDFSGIYADDSPDKPTPYAFSAKKKTKQYALADYLDKK
jgi:hypothetical protein